MYISVVFFFYNVFERQSGLPVATNSETYAAKAQYQSVVLTSGLVTFIAAYVYRIFNSLVCLCLLLRIVGHRRLWSSLEVLVYFCGDLLVQCL